MLSRWYDPILVVGIERTLPARLAALLGTLGVDVHPVPLHLDAEVTRWEDYELRKFLMQLLSGQMSLRTFNVRVAILSEQRRRIGQPWAIASSYLADIPLPVLSHYLNPSVLWCQCAPANAADLLLSVQPPTAGWSPSDALDLCTRRHQTLIHWLEGYRILDISSEAILKGRGEVIEQITEFCGLTPSAEQLYQSAVVWTASPGEYGEEKDNASVDEGRGYAHVACEEEGR